MKFAQLLLVTALSSVTSAFVPIWYAAGRRRGLTRLNYVDGKDEHPSPKVKLVETTTISPLPLVDDAADSLVHDIVTGRQAHPLLRKKWGVDNEHEGEYWFDARIHTFGNSGFWGAVHAAMAPLATKMIDLQAYHGVDVRKEVAQELAGYVGKAKARVLDLCCGVGISTRALQEAFPDAETVMGIDTSPEMVAMARFLTHHLSVVEPLSRVLLLATSTFYTTLLEQGNKMKRTVDEAYRQMAASTAAAAACVFTEANAEQTELPSQSFDLVTIMYGFHEAPSIGRAKMLEEARRLLSPEGTLAVVDISSDYTPSKSMLSGEPYVLEYQANIHKQLDTFEGFNGAKYKTLVPGHVGMWLMRRSAAPPQLQPVPVMVTP